MHEANQFRSLLVELESVLQQHGGGHGVDAVERALNGSDAAVEGLLTSNVLWGGPGSIADHVGRINERSRMWVNAFLQWQRDGI